MMPSEFTEDRIGMIFVAPWILIFTVLVRDRPVVCAQASLGNNAHAATSATP
jgi:hypothetical protein